MICEYFLGEHCSCDLLELPITATDNGNYTMQANMPSGNATIEIPATIGNNLILDLTKLNESGFSGLVFYDTSNQIVTITIEDIDYSQFSIKTKVCWNN